MRHKYGSAVLDANRGKPEGSARSGKLREQISLVPQCLLVSGRMHWEVNA